LCDTATATATVTVLAISTLFFALSLSLCLSVTATNIEQDDDDDDDDDAEEEVEDGSNITDEDTDVDAEVEVVVGNGNAGGDAVDVGLDPLGLETGTVSLGLARSFSMFSNSRWRFKKASSLKSSTLSRSRSRPLVGLAGDVVGDTSGEGVIGDEVMSIAVVVPLVMALSLSNGSFFRRLRKDGV